MNATTNGRYINFIEIGGDGPPVVLIHGIAASMFGWASLMPDLVSAGYHAYAIDLLGHGGSAKPSDPQSYTLEVVYETFEDWVEGIYSGSPLTLIGHSLGGHLSLMYGLHHQDNIRALVLINPFINLKQLSPLLSVVKYKPSLGIKALQLVPPHLIDFFLGWDIISKAHFSPRVRLQIAVDYKRASPYILNIPRTIPDLSPKLCDIYTKSLVIWGKRDLTLNPASFPPVVSALPNANGHPIPGSGHLPHIGEPELVNHLVLEFINSTS